ncbi:MAG: hypothetical protein LBI40_00865 [Treponema sp.]|jgi:hypothetical protein|nr:hypothetical protein [Treponema sp.]
MTILINDEEVDFKLVDEKTVGEVLSGIEEWLNNIGNHISGLQIDGVSVRLDEIEAVCMRELSDVESIGIQARSFTDFAIDSISYADAVITAFAESSFSEQPLVYKAFEESAAYRFLKENIPNIAETVCNTLEGTGLSLKDASAFLKERVREFAFPQEEIASQMEVVSEIVSRLENLPLDVQTGKDTRAAETVRLFSAVMEKLFRIFSIMSQKGCSINTVRTIDFGGEMPIERFISDFSAVLQEMLNAYKSGDTILCGDLAEYEMAPRLSAFFSALTETSK